MFFIRKAVLLPLAQYICSTMRPSNCCNNIDSLFPIPPPFPWFVEISGGRRVSTRRRVVHAKQLMVNIMVCSLSHLHLGFAVEAPPRGRVGQLLNPEQEALIRECWDRASSFCRLMKDGARQTLINADNGLTEMLQSLTSLEAVPYCRTRVAGTVFTPSSNVGRPSCDTGRHELVATMVGFPDVLQPFDPKPYLCADSRAAYDDPAHLEIAEDKWGPPVAPFTAPVREVVLLAHRWDKVDRLSIFPATGPDSPAPDELCNLFCLVKPDTDPLELRQIMDRRGRNRKERQLHTGSRMLPHSSQWLDLYIPPDKNAYFSSNDLRHMYHVFSNVPRARARTMCLSTLVPIADVIDTAAYRSLDVPLVGRFCRVAFKGLGMGDGSAVDIAQESHCNGVSTFGGMRADESLYYRSLFPVSTTDCWEGIRLDDHLGCQLGPPTGMPGWDDQDSYRDKEAFQSSADFYDASGLLTHPKKAVRRATVVTAWGGEMEGDAGWHGPPRHKLAGLSYLSAKIAAEGVISAQLHGTICGVWAYMLTFRRCLFSLLSHLYRIHWPDPHANDPTKLSLWCRNELLLLGCLAPMALSNLRASYDPIIYSADASPYGLGVTSAYGGFDMVRELWRRADQVGRSRVMLHRLSADLKEIGVDGFEDDMAAEDLVKDERHRQHCDKPHVRLGKVRQSGAPDFMTGASSAGTPSATILRFLFKSGGMEARARGMIVGKPEKPLLWTWHAIEVCGGWGGIGKYFAQAGYTVVNIELKLGWDMLDATVLQWLLHVTISGRVRFCIP